MADRSLYSHTSDPMPSGLQFLQQYSERLKLLLDSSVMQLTAVGGTGNVVTATLDPTLTAGLVQGMKFTLTWAAANTGPVTLTLNGGVAVPVLDGVGAGLAGSALAAGQRSLIEYVSGSFRIISGGADSGAGAAPYFMALTASTTWTKPSGYADSTPVLIEAWGAGGSGGWSNTTLGGGGGGGAYVARRLRYADLAASLTISIGAGGAAQAANAGGNPGGNTTVGAILTAYGGAGGGQAGNGGAGGGERASSSVSGGPANTNALSIWGGGGGGGVAGHAVFGGAGGAKSDGSAAGQSLYGGAGGTSASGPGGLAGAGGNRGGGGAGSYAAVSGAGGRGEVNIWIGA